jgi:hypothetical protein
MLLAAEIPLGRLHGDVPKQKLDLVQFTSGIAAQSGASSSVMPHAALSSLCRMPDHAESIDRSSQGQVSGRW